MVAGPHIQPNYTPTPKNGPQTCTHKSADTAPADGVATCACRYILRNWKPVPIPPRQKKPVIDGWPDLRLDIEDVPSNFAATSNIGIILGASRLADVDLDCEEARAVADFFLPETGCIFGRRSSPSSHRLYEPTEGEFGYKEFTDPLLAGGKGKTDAGRAMLVELRAGRNQTMCPPSIHPEGEPVEWAIYSDPAKIDPQELQNCVAQIASSALLARYWSEAPRNQAAMALAGGLLRAGWSEEATRHFIDAVAYAACDEERSNRTEVVKYTAKKLAEDQPVKGWPTLAEYLGNPVVSKVREWLGIQGRHHGSRVGSGAPMRWERLLSRQGEIIKLLRLELTARNNPYLRQEARTLIELCRVITQRIKRGKVDEDGWSPVPYSWIAKRVDLGNQTVSAHTRLGKGWLFEMRLVRRRNHPDPATGELPDRPFSCLTFFRPKSCDLAELLTRIASYDPPEGIKAKWGGARVRCPDHPDAKVIPIRWECSECHRQLGPEHVQHYA